MARCLNCDASIPSVEDYCSGQCKREYEKSTQGAGQINSFMVYDPIFEWVEIAPSRYMIHCWYRSRAGVVYYNREPTSFRELPFCFITKPMDMSHVLQISLT